MGRRHREHSPFDIYHITSRGVGNMLIFEDDDDRRKLISLLQDKAEAACATIPAWCLMGNHFHLVAELALESLSRMMGTVKSRYAKYFNERHGRQGHLFEQRFWSTPIRSEEQLLEVVRYVHMNPQKARVAPANEYPWSSYRTYIDGVRGLADPSMVLGMLGGVDAFVELHKETPEELQPRTKLARISDDALVEMACQELNLPNISQLLCQPQHERDAGLRQLKEQGFTCRQLQRLTGLGKAVIARA